MVLRFHGLLGGALLLWASIAHGALYIRPTASFTDLLEVMHVPISATLLDVVPAVGFWRQCQEWLRPGSSRDVKTIAEAVSFLDRYAERLIASYPVSLHDTLREGYFGRVGVIRGSDAMIAHGLYTIDTEPHEVYITATIVDHSQVYLRILLIHEVLIHKGQHLQMLALWGRERFNGSVEEFKRASEITAYLMEWELAQRIPVPIIAQDLSEVPLSDEHIADILESWGKYRSSSREEPLMRMYGSYFFKDSKVLYRSGALPLLSGFIVERQWNDNRGLRPYAEIAAVTARWRR